MKFLGKHIIADFLLCKSNILNNVSSVEEAMVRAARKSGAFIIDTSFHHFSPYGVSGVVIIQESHLAIHTWPEYKFVSVDVFTCGNAVDPHLAFQELKIVFLAKEIIISEHRRGKIQNSKETSFPPSSTRKLDQNKIFRNVWFTQKNDQFAISVKHAGEILEKKKSLYQDIELIDTDIFGKMLILDGVINVAEKDEFAHHEMLTHIPLNTHSNAYNILILGGGDGFVAREILKYQEVKSVTLVERDEEVINISQNFFLNTEKTFNDKRLKLIIDDAVRFLKKYSQKYYDIILIDIFQPFSGKDEFLQDDSIKLLKNILHQTGICVYPLGSPIFNRKEIIRKYKLLKKYFPVKNIKPYISFISTYPSGIWLYIMFSSNNLNSFKERKDFLSSDLKYYNKAIHHSAFILPNYIKAIFN